MKTEKIKKKNTAGLGDSPSVLLSPVLGWWDIQRW